MGQVRRSSSLARRRRWVRPCVAWAFSVAAAIVALSRESISFRPYTELINKETELIGVSDHLASELPTLMRYAQSGKLTFPESALRFVDLDAAQINAALDALERSTDQVRTVIVARS